MLLEGRIRPRGIGAFVAGNSATLRSDLVEFLATQEEIERQADWNANALTLQ